MIKLHYFNLAIPAHRVNHISFIVCPGKISRNWLLKFKASEISLTKIEGKQAPVALNFSS